MPEPIISVEGLGKRYQIQHQRTKQPYITLRDELAQRVSALWRRRTATEDGVAPTEDFWALRDVSFEVQPGDVVGIIGRNGAGKSTLLKILSRITEPTEGRVVLGGRAASLLEVGTGFHPELSGRDNIFLNGSLLGMSHSEIVRKFDEIVAFAGTEKFLDTPLKRYSSGMAVRLAFAVAAHLEPEILIIDEVLAVGDAEFQQKCLGKIGEVAREGRTILFVSHHLATVENLCQKGVLLEGGRVRYAGTAKEALRAYSSQSLNSQAVSILERRDRQGTGAMRFAEVQLLGPDGTPVEALRAGAGGTVAIRIRNGSAAPLRSFHLSVGVDNAFGQRVTTWSTTYSGGDWPSTPASDFVVHVRLPKVSLAPSRYSYNLFAMVSGEIADWLRPAGSFEVDAGDYYGSGQLPTLEDGAMISDHAFSLSS